MSAQLTLLASEPVACTRPLVELARDVARSPTLPLWAAVAGEAWFARAWAACDRWPALSLLAYAAWGWDPDVSWWADSIHLPCMDAMRGDTAHALDFRPCAECAATVRRAIGAATLEMLRLGLARKAPR